MDWANIGFTILNSIIISIPEETFVIYLSLLILGKPEFIKIKPGNLPRFVACLIPAAFAPNIMRWLLPQVTDYLMIIGILFIFTLIVFIYRIKDKKDILRIFIGTALSLIAVMLAQIAYTPLVMFGTGISMNEVNNTPILLFIWTLPERAIEFSLLILLTIKKNMTVKINILSILSRNKLVAFITVFLLTFNAAFLAIMGKLIFFDNILAKTSLFNIVLITALVIMFPIMNISLLAAVIYSVYYRYSIRLLLSKERISTLVSVLAVYTEERNYGKIDNLVTDLHNQVNVL
jgi:hypothetical protein